jgi:hypothetical protein
MSKGDNLVWVHFNAKVLWLQVDILKQIASIILKVDVGKH